jgi:pimeloyl-[acyl-carrier protein] methyl ester esterase
VTTLVLLPGMDGTGELFSPLITALGPSISTIVVSYPTTECFTYAELVTLVGSRLPQEPFVLLGESFSGPVAISLAAANPPGLRGVVLSCSFASSPRPLVALAAPLLSLPLPVPPSWALAPALLGAASTRELRSALVAALDKVGRRVLRHRLSEAMRADVRSSLAKVRVPVLYLQASSDLVVPKACASQVQAALPSARVQPVRGPHLLLQANPTESAKAIREFLASAAHAA